MIWPRRRAERGLLGMLERWRQVYRAGEVALHPFTRPDWTRPAWNAAALGDLAIITRIRAQPVWVAEAAVPPEPGQPDSAATEWRLLGRMFAPYRPPAGLIEMPAALIEMPAGLIEMPAAPMPTADLAGTYDASGRRKRGGPPGRWDGTGSNHSARRHI